MSVSKKPVATLTKNGEAVAAYLKTERLNCTDSEGNYIPKPWYSMYLSERLNEIDDTTVQVEVEESKVVRKVDASELAELELLRKVRKPKQSPKPQDDDDEDDEDEDDSFESDLEGIDEGEDETAGTHYDSAVISDSYDDEAEA